MTVWQSCSWIAQPNIANKLTGLPRERLMNSATHSACSALETWRSFSPTALTKLKERKVPHIIIVGGGVAGLILATRLGHALGRRNRARISLIDRSWSHVWKPMLHTFAAGTWNIYQQQVQYVAHARAHHFEYVPGQLVAVDHATARASVWRRCEKTAK